MKFRVLLSLLVTANLVAQEVNNPQKTKTKSTPKTNETVVDKDEKNLTESTQKIVQNVINNIYEDGKNIHIEAKVTNLVVNHDISYDRAEVSNPDLGGILTGSIGINLFPNTWDITISYAGQIAEDISIYGSDSDGLDWLDKYQ